MPAFFLYARKSTEDEDRQVLSIESQIHELREFARREALTVIEEFVEAKTAKEPGRPVFNLMMEQIEQGKANGLLAWHPDRLARNSVDGGRIIYLVDNRLLNDRYLRLVPDSFKDEMIKVYNTKALRLTLEHFWKDAGPQG